MISKILIAQVFSSVNADKATGFLYSNYCLDNWERRNKADPSTEPFKHSIGCSLGANCTTGGFVLLEMKGSTYSTAETFELADTERIVEPWLNSQETSMVDLCVDVTFDTLQGKMMQGVTVVEIAADKSVCRKARGGGDGNSGAGNSGAGNSGAGNSSAGNSSAGNGSAGNSSDKEPNSEVEDKAEFFGLGKTSVMLVGAGVVAVMILILTAACCCLAKKEARQPATSFGSMPAHRAPQQRLPRRRR